MRVFFAITLEAQTKTLLTNFIRFHKTKSTIKNIYWTKPDHLHITLRFLSHIEEDKLSLLIKNVETQLTQEKINPFFVNSKDLLLFSTRHAKILTLEIESNDALIQLVELINVETEKLGFQRETRDFKPHITLGRIKNNLATPLANLSIPPLEIQVNTITLFESKPTEEGSHYIERCMFDFPLIDEAQSRK